MAAIAFPVTIENDCSKIIFKNGTVPIAYKESLFTDNFPRGVIQNFRTFEHLDNYQEIGIWLSAHDYKLVKEGEFILVNWRE